MQQENRRKRDGKAITKDEQMLLMLIQAPHGSKFKMTVGVNNNSAKSGSSWANPAKPVYKLLIEAPR